MRGDRVAAAVSAVALATGLGGCLSIGAAERMRSDIDRLQERMEAMSKRDAEIDAQLARLHALLDEAALLVGRNSADLGNTVAKNAAEIAQLAGRVEEARHLAEQLDTQVSDYRARVSTLEEHHNKPDKPEAARPALAAAPAPAEDKDDVWKNAQEALTSGNTDEGRRLLKLFTQRFSADPRTPRALFTLGKSFFDEGNHSEAVGYFSNLITSYGKADEVPEAMWLLADSFIHLRFCSDARATLESMVKQHPRSTRAPQARQRLKEVHKLAKDKNACSS